MLDGALECHSTDSVVILACPHTASTTTIDHPQSEKQRWNPNVEFLPESFIEKKLMTDSLEKMMAK
jgi:hypothetical protein